MMNLLLILFIIKFIAQINMYKRYDIEILSIDVGLNKEHLLKIMDKMHAKS